MIINSSRKLAEKMIDLTTVINGSDVSPNIEKAIAEFADSCGYVMQAVDHHIKALNLRMEEIKKTGKTGGVGDMNDQLLGEICFEIYQLLKIAQIRIDSLGDSKDILYDFYRKEQVPGVYKNIEAKGLAVRRKYLKWGANNNNMECVVEYAFACAGFGTEGGSAFPITDENSKRSLEWADYMLKKGSTYYTSAAYCLYAVYYLDKYNEVKSYSNGTKQNYFSRFAANILAAESAAETIRGFGPSKYPRNSELVKQCIGYYSGMFYCLSEKPENRMTRYFDLHRGRSCFLKATIYYDNRNMGDTKVSDSASRSLRMVVERIEQEQKNKR